VPEWSAEIVVDEPLARRLLGQFPELEVRSLRPFAEGWDYAIWAANEEWAFRFPRRAIAVPGVEVEIAALPVLAPLLPLPVAAPAFVGSPTDRFPWPFYGSRLLPGRELTTLDLDDRARVVIGQALARFLRRLHEVELELELPTDSNRRADMSVRVPKTRAQLAELEVLGDWPGSREVERVLERAEALPPPSYSAIVHGDLHVRQVLADDELAVTGVIDWVDLCRSDPAIDLSMFWSFVPTEGRQAFLEAYGAVTSDQLLRARVVALSLGAALAAYGHVERNRAVEREALTGLERAMVDLDFGA
jgi:aminoglycoside phosphotransferase (APT) family kinase protein